VTATKLGVLPWGQATDWPAFEAFARRVEALGYESLWSWDHLYAIFGDPYQPIFEGWTALSALAMATQRIRLGLMVGANTFRNPALVAKSAVTVDHVSDGRAILGLGAAWFELEHHHDGFDFGTGFGQRCDWLDESVGLIRRLLDGETVTYHSEKYTLDEARHAPRPVQPHLPITIGGSGETKTLRTVARYADIWNGIGTVDFLRHKTEVLDAHCAAVGRDPAAIERTLDCQMVIRDTQEQAARDWAGYLEANRTPLDRVQPWLGNVQQITERILAYRTLGFRGVNVEVPAPYDMETIERLIGEVKPLVDSTP